MFGQVISTTGNKWTIGQASPSSPNDYSAIIEALKTVGETKILSSPKLTVVNSEEAKILVGSKQVYVTTSAVQGQTSTQTAESVSFVDVGVQLFVTPTITSDGFISMKVSLKCLLSSRIIKPQQVILFQLLKLPRRRQLFLCVIIRLL